MNVEIAPPRTRRAAAKAQPRPIDMLAHAGEAAEFLKLLANDRRLVLLCLLLEGERAVGDLAAAADMSQPNVSQHLGKLRALGLVETRRMGTTVYYRLAADAAVRAILGALHDRFCPR